MDTSQTVENAGEKVTSTLRIMSEVVYSCSAEVIGRTEQVFSSQTVDSICKLVCVAVIFCDLPGCTTALCTAFSVC
jgi:hypothetical protein